VGQDGIPPTLEIGRFYVGLTGSTRKGKPLWSRVYGKADKPLDTDYTDRTDFTEKAFKFQHTLCKLTERKKVAV
jgi:hypothetical protein